MKTKVTEFEQLLTVTEVSEILHLYRETVAQMLRDGVLKRTLIAKHKVMVHPDDLRDYINKQRGVANADDEMSVEDVREHFGMKPAKK